MMIIVADPVAAKRVNYRQLNRDVGQQLMLTKRGGDDDLASEGLVGARDGKWRALRLAW